MCNKVYYLLFYNLINMAIPLFSLQLRYNIIPRLVTIGKYDGSHHCLTAATSENKVNLNSSF